MGGGRARRLRAGREHALRSLAFTERRMRRRDERSVFESGGAVDGVNLPEAGQVEETGNLDHVGRIDVEFTQKQFEHVLGHVVGNFEANG